MLLTWRCWVKEVEEESPESRTEVDMSVSRRQSGQVEDPSLSCSVTHETRHVP